MNKREKSDDDCENHSSSSIGLNIGSLSSKKLSQRMPFSPEYVSPTPNFLIFKTILPFIT